MMRIKRKCTKVFPVLYSYGTNCRLLIASPFNSFRATILSKMSVNWCFVFIAFSLCVLLFKRIICVLFDEYRKRTELVKT